MISSIHRCTCRVPAYWCTLFVFLFFIIIFFIVLFGSAGMHVLVCAILYCLNWCRSRLEICSPIRLHSHLFMVCNQLLYHHCNHHRNHRHCGAVVKWATRRNSIKYNTNNNQNNNDELMWFLLLLLLRLLLYLETEKVR